MNLYIYICWHIWAHRYANGYHPGFFHSQAKFYVSARKLLKCAAVVQKFTMFTALPWRFLLWWRDDAEGWGLMYYELLTYQWVIWSCITYRLYYANTADTNTHHTCNCISPMLHVGYMYHTWSIWVFVHMETWTNGSAFLAPRSSGKAGACSATGAGKAAPFDRWAASGCRKLFTCDCYWCDSWFTVGDHIRIYVLIIYSWILMVARCYGVKNIDVDELFTKIYKR